MNTRTVTRRDFLGRAGGVAETIAAPSAFVRRARGEPSPTSTPLVGIQVAPFNLLDEGILRRRQTKAGPALLNTPLLAFDAKPASWQWPHLP